ncbi:MAG: polysaccharide deacetylase family protein [Nanoarchaeota archaeon]
MKKIAYLTIDDAPSKDFRKKIDYLSLKNIPAIIFCEGGCIKKRPKEVIYAIRKGFIIGNHSYNHQHFSKIPLKECFEEIKKTNELIEEIYKKSKIKRPIKLFRFPYGDRGGKNKKKLEEYLKFLGYKQPRFEKINYFWYKFGRFHKHPDIFWTFNIKEYEIGKKKFGNQTIDSIYNLIDKSYRLKSSSRDIILIHDHHDTTKYFNSLINRLLKKGIKFKMPQLK